jgi:hypothetical protein
MDHDGAIVLAFIITILAAILCTYFIWRAGRCCNLWQSGFDDSDSDRGRYYTSRRRSATPPRRSSRVATGQTAATQTNTAQSNTAQNQTAQTNTAQTTSAQNNTAQNSTT